MTSKISIIIPHYNHPELLEVCLESLKHGGGPIQHTETLVVDDASTDDSVAWIKRNAPQVKLLQHETNQGFVRAIQTGVEAAQGDLLVFLNNDTRLSEGWLQHQTEPWLRNREDAAYGSVLTDWDCQRAVFMGATVNLLGFGFEEQGELPAGDAQPWRSLMVCGGAMAIPRDLYNRVGGFDSDYGMIYEDLDLGWRLNALGYSCWMLPNARVAHRVHASLGRVGFVRKSRFYLGNPYRTVFKNLDETCFAKVIPVAQQLLRARERVVLQHKTPVDSRWQRCLRRFYRSTQPQLWVDQELFSESVTGRLQQQRQTVQSMARFSTRDIFRQFVPSPQRLWFYDENQRQELDSSGYSQLEQCLLSQLMAELKF